MTIFTPAQLEDLREIQALCQAKGTDIVIIGAMAYRLFIHDVDRETRDIDLAVAINHEDIEPFYGLLAGLGWERVRRHEQRWLTTRGTLMDVLPSGVALRSRGRVEWPQSGLSMSLAGFDHVFRDSVTVALGLSCNAKWFRRRCWRCSRWQPMRTTPTAEPKTSWICAVCSAGTNAKVIGSSPTLFSRPHSRILNSPEPSCWALM